MITNHYIKLPKDFFINGKTKQVTTFSYSKNNYTINGQVYPNNRKCRDDETHYTYVVLNKGILVSVYSTDSVL
jgi:hypothetical protein